MLGEILTRGDRARIMPALWNASYYWMVKTQNGIAYYFHAKGRPVKVSGYYEEKTQEEEKRDRQKAIERYHRNMAPARQQWEEYLEKHPTDPVAFEWKSLLGMPLWWKASTENLMIS